MSRNFRNLFDLFPSEYFYYNVPARRNERLMPPVEVLAHSVIMCQCLWRWYTHTHTHTHTAKDTHTHTHWNEQTYNQIHIVRHTHPHRDTPTHIHKHTETKTHRNSKHTETKTHRNTITRTQVVTQLWRGCDAAIGSAPTQHAPLRQRAAFLYRSLRKTIKKQLNRTWNVNRLTQGGQPFLWYLFWKHVKDTGCDSVTRTYRHFRNLWMTFYNGKICVAAWMDLSQSQGLGGWMGVLASRVGGF